MDKQKNMYELSVKQWNPYVGCKFDCSYCESSFKRQAKRQKWNCKNCYNYQPHCHPERLSNYLPRTKKSEFIFTCSSGDISFCPTPFLEQIIGRISEMPDRTFLLQTKNPKTFNRLKSLPDNLIIGVTLETNRDELALQVSKAPKVSQRFKDFAAIDHHLKMVTIEPVLDFDLSVMVKWIKEIEPCVVWLGFDSGNNDLPEPDYDKFWTLYHKLDEMGINVILKTVKNK